MFFNLAALLRLFLRLHPRLKQVIPLGQAENGGK